MNTGQLHNWPQNHSAKTYVYGFEQQASFRFVLLPRRRCFHPGIARFGGDRTAADVVGFAHLGHVFQHNLESTSPKNGKYEVRMSVIMVCDGHHRLAYVKERRLQRMSDAPHMSTSRNRVTNSTAGAAFSSGNSSFGG